MFLKGFLQNGAFLNFREFEYMAVSEGYKTITCLRQVQCGQKRKENKNTLPFGMMEDAYNETDTGDRLGALQNINKTVYV